MRIFRELSQLRVVIMFSGKCWDKYADNMSCEFVLALAGTK